MDDWIFDIAITANRPDCQSIYGIAREVAAVLGKECKEPALDFTETDVKKDDVVVVAQKGDDKVELSRTTFTVKQQSKKNAQQQ
mgnify:CR=1 FL=1